LKSDEYVVTILRPPMVYGKDSKGNFNKLLDFAYKTIVFPKINNQRSFLFIDNLSNQVKNLIDYCMPGLYFPQNNKYMCTTETIKLIAKFINKRIWFTTLFNPLV